MSILSSQQLEIAQVSVNSDITTIDEIKQIYYKRTQLQTKITDHSFQLNITERQELWWNIVELWIELSMKITNIPIDDQYIITNYCLDIIKSLYPQLISDLNNTKFIEKTFSACLMMLNLPYITTFLCKINQTSDDPIFSLNIHLILSVANQSVRFLLSDTTNIFNERTDLLVILINYIETRISSIELRSESIVERILTFFWNVSDRTFFVPILVKIGLPESVVRWLSYSNITTYEHCIPLIAIIHNLSRHDEGVDALNKYQTVEIIKDFQCKYINIPNREISLLIPMILAELCTPEQLKRDKQIMNDVLNQLLQRTMNAAKSETLWSDAGFHISEFLSVMVKLFVVEERTVDYILCHAETELPSDISSTIYLFSSLLISFSDALNRNNQLEQFTLIAILNILWSFSFQIRYLQELIINNKEAIFLVENLAENNNKNAIINQYKPRFDGSHTVLNNTQNILSNKKPSIMISYSHDDKIFCKNLVHFLLTQQHIFDVWIDQNHLQTAGDIWEMIANGMEQANVILCLISNYYFQSKSCRQEFIYATDTLRKLIVPVLLENFKPKGWLGIRIPGLKYVRFQNLDQPDQVKMTALLDTILATLSLSTSSTDRHCSEHQEYYEPIASYLHSSPTAHARFRFNQWSLSSSDDIKAWFSHYHISTQLRDLYDFQTGQEMIHYGEKLIENSEKHMEIYSKAFMKKYNGDELLPHEFQRFVQAIKELLKYNQTSIISSY